MTANEIFDSVIALMFSEEVDKTDYQTNFIAHLNMKLAETFYPNNSIRKAKGKEPLEEPPIITSLDDEVEYENEITRSLLPLGISGDLYVEDDDTGITNDYRERYRAGLLEVGRARFEEVASVG